jgi:hypothetical protein
MTICSAIVLAAFLLLVSKVTIGDLIVFIGMAIVTLYIVDRVIHWIYVAGIHK